MSNNSIGSKLSLGLNHLAKKVAAAPANEVKDLAKGVAKAGKVAGDALVRSAAPVAAVNKSAADAVLNAEMRLAKAYDPNPAVFAKNMIKATLADEFQG